MEKFEDWIDQTDDFDPERDRHPERDEADSGLIARLLGIGERHVRRLTNQGVLRQLPNGNYSRMASINAYVDHKAAQPLPMSAGLRSRQEQILARRLEREAAESIRMDEALGTFDAIGGHFIESIGEVGRQASTGRTKAEREHVASVISSATDRLRARFAEERETLRTGSRPE